MPEGKTMTEPALLDLDADRLREECGVFGIVRPSGRRRHHGARPARAAAPRPGSRRHRLVRRPALPLRTAHGPRRRQLFPPRGDRAAARHVGDRPCALFDHRRNHPAQRAAAVRRAQRRRLRGRPQRQSDQRPDAAPPARARRRHHAVDLRHRGHPASGRALARNRFVDRFIDGLRMLEGSYALRRR